MASAINKFEYVRNFEQEDRCLPNCWMVVRIDGKGFHRFSTLHKFEKPNDERALRLMNRAAIEVMKEINDICLSYGQSDEYSFIIRKDSDLYNRRSSKLTSNIATAFTAAYVFYWPQFFTDVKIEHLPSFDARMVLYPNEETLRDYISWRQVDCHINNLYNTVFWALVLKGGLSNNEAQDRLKGTLAKDKNEILFSEFGINYNNEPELFKKGSAIVRRKKSFKCLNVDMIKDGFWEEYPDILARKK